MSLYSNIKFFIDNYPSLFSFSVGFAAGIILMKWREVDPERAAETAQVGRTMSPGV